MNKPPRFIVSIQKDHHGKARVIYDDELSQRHHLSFERMMGRLTIEQVNKELQDEYEEFLTSRDT